MSANLGEPTGSTSVRGHIWPLYERRVFAISVKGALTADESNVTTLTELLEKRLRGTGLQVDVEAQIHMVMSPEDQAEMDRLNAES